ncbi:MAG: hypothetical protein HYS27_07270 [Deltaproteobacteria bacterium]|nr:hypothetical protein [Deltaproteobacteria bacterium]
MAHCLPGNLNVSFAYKVIEHDERPRNVGSFDKADPSVGAGLLSDNDVLASVGHVRRIFDGCGQRIVFSV